MRSKYGSYNSPSFGKWADHSLDEFNLITYGTAGENANNTAYHPNHELTERNTDKGVPNFERYSPKAININKH